MTQKETVGESSDPSSAGLEDLVRMASSTNGFRRENAVRRLGLLGSPLAIPCLIVRANDWVAQVRAAAHAALTNLINAGHASAFVASLPALIHLQSCRRGDHSGLLEAVTNLLLRKENLPALVAAIESPDAHIARIATRLVVEHGVIQSAEIVTRCLSHNDVVVRSTAIDLLRDLEEDSFAVAVTKALHDPYMPVRREAFQQLLRRDRDSGLETAKDLLFDPSASVREIAVQHLLAAGESVDETYADALRRSGDRVAIVSCVLWGWGMTNSRSRLPQVQELLGARFPSIRRAAVQSIARLLQEDARPHLQQALGDTSPAVCKEAARLICKLGLTLDVETLVRIAASSETNHVAYACCRVVRQSGKWAWLRFVLRVYGAPDSRVPRNAFSGEVDAWEAHFNRSSAQPDKGTLEEIVRLLRLSRVKLTDSQVRLLEFTIGSYGATL